MLHSVSTLSVNGNDIKTEGWRFMMRGYHHQCAAETWQGRRDNSIASGTLIPCSALASLCFPFRTSTTVCYAFTEYSAVEAWAHSLTHRSLADGTAHAPAYTLAVLRLGSHPPCRRRFPCTLHRPRHLMPILFAQVES